jgi:hypothetical protein
MKPTQQRDLPQSGGRRIPALDRLDYFLRPRVC